MQETPHAVPLMETLKHLLLLADGIYRETQWWPEEISPGRGWVIDTLDGILSPNGKQLQPGTATCRIIAGRRTNTDDGAQRNIR